LKYDSGTSTSTKKVCEIISDDDDDDDDDDVDYLLIYLLTYASSFQCYMYANLDSVS